MTLLPDQINVVNRIVKRLRSPEEATYRGGGRAVAAQVVEHRLEVVQALRSAIVELGESERNEYQRGYHEALSDVLVATEAALEPKEQEVQARLALAAAPTLQHVLDRIAPAPLTPSEIAAAIGKSAPSAGRYFSQLRRLGLIAELASASDARERPHRITPLGARLAQPTVVVDKKAAKRGAAVHVVSKRELVPVSAEEVVRYLEFGNSVDFDEDPVTGLKVLDDSFQQLLATQLEIHRQAHLPLTIMRVDICNFREVTASADFSGVNRFIIRIARTLKRELTSVSAELARYDFDKFVVMLPKQPMARAKELADALLSKLEPVTANIGIADSASPKIRDASALLDASNAALQEAKQEGVTVAMFA